MTEHNAKMKSKFIAASEGEAYWQPGAVSGGCVTIPAQKPG